MARFYLLGSICIFALAACGPNSPPESSADTKPTISWPGESWQTSTPEQEGLDGQAIAQLDEEFRAGKHGYIDSMLIVRNGRLAFEAYYENDYQAINRELMTGESGPYNYYDATWHPFYKGSDLHTLQSTTKSFMSALVGIAIARGDLPGVDATLGELLPHRNISDPQKAAITLDNILTMRSGFEWEEIVSYWDPRNDAITVESTDDWVGYLLAKPIAYDQGTTYYYNSISTQLMSEMVSTATGRGLDDYAEEVLFGPIGIKDYFWKTAPEGSKDVSGGLYLKPRDLARFGLLFERNGEWNGEQIVPAEWVAKSSEAIVLDTWPERPDRNNGYGYQWWIYRHGNDGGPFVYGTSGWGGQLALIVPELNLVGVFTGWRVYEGPRNESVVKLFYDRVVMPAARAAR
jgi:CubicO group peptidase (beta-lactamase class C family)